MSRVDTQTIEVRLSGREEQRDVFFDEVKGFVLEHGVSSYDRADCNTCPGEYPLALGALTNGRCIPCYAESRGIILVDLPSVDERRVPRGAMPHYVHDDANPSFENAVRLLEDQ